MFYVKRNQKYVGFAREWRATSGSGTNVEICRDKHSGKEFGAIEGGKQPRKFAEKFNHQNGD